MGFANMEKAKLKLKIEVMSDYVFVVRDEENIKKFLFVATPTEDKIETESTLGVKFSAIKSFIKSNLENIKDSAKKTDGKVSGLDGKVESKINNLDEKLESKINNLDEKLESKINNLDGKVSGLDGKLESRDAALEKKFDSIAKIVGGSISPKAEAFENEDKVGDKMEARVSEL